MRNIIIIFLVFISQFSLQAQDLNAKVIVNAQLTGNENFQVFKTMQTQLNEFVNNTDWTAVETKPEERISCNFVINITEADINTGFFVGSLQVQSSRPVFGSSYSSSLYNVNDKDFSFNYTEFQQLIYTPNQFQSNLVSVLTYHIYMVLGLDADSFKLNSGDTYFKQAQNILNYSQQENFKGWKLADGLQNRFTLIRDMLSPAFSKLRQVNYDYHRLGLDLMNENVEEGKTQIARALLNFDDIAKNRPNAYITQVFFDTKVDEIEQIFSSGPKVDKSKLLTVLNRIAPMYSKNWRNIQL